MKLLTVTGEKMQQYPWETEPSLKRYSCVVSSEDANEMVELMTRDGMTNITITKWEGNK